MSVEADFAAWLRSGSLNAIAKSDAIDAAWGKLASARENLSGLAYKADADAEAARQLDLFGVPMCVEQLQVDDLRVDLVGRCVTLTADRAGYAQGASVFVLGARELDRTARTNLTVLRKLA